MDVSALHGPERDDARDGELLAEQDAALLTVLEDLDSWGSAMQHRERVQEVRDRSRSAYSEVTLASRLMASQGLPIGVEVRGLGPLSGHLERVGQGWVSLTVGHHLWAVRTQALTCVRGLADRSVPEQAWSPLARLGFATVLRGVSDAGEPSVVTVDSGFDKATALRDATVLRVGADFVELRVDGEPGSTIVAIAAVIAVRTGL